MDFATFLTRAIADVFFNKPPNYETKDIWKEISKKQLEENSAKITQYVLKEMYCENTGSHICDSGGIYGYGYQRSQAIKDKDWMEMEPINVEIDKYSSGEYYMNITKNSYLILCDALEYDIEMDRIFHAFCQSERNFIFGHYNKYSGKYTHEYFRPKKESYYACMKAFTDGYLKKFKADYEYLNGYNTYNGDSCLDKTLQWEMFRIGNGKLEGDYIILQIHNGCDVRGGYSTPHVFRFEEDEFWWRLDDLSCRCPNYDYNYQKQKNGVQKTLDGKDTKDPIIDLDHLDSYSDDCGYHWYRNCGEDLDKGAEFITDEEGNHHLICKKCKAEVNFF